MFGEKNAEKKCNWRDPISSLGLVGASDVILPFLTLPILIFEIGFELFDLPEFLKVFLDCNI
jgi:hypothetical protein